MSPRTPVAPLPWGGLLLGGAVAGAGAQLLELAFVRRPLGVRDSLLALLLLALAGALAETVLTVLIFLPFHRPRGGEPPGEGARRWAVGAAFFVGIALVGAGAVIQIGSGVRGGVRALLAAFLTWCALGALAGARIGSLADSRIAGSWRLATGALVALLLAGPGLALVRAGSAAAPLLGSLGTAERRTPPPGSVILIVLDTTRADVFGAYGSTAGETPVFDRFAAEGRLWEEMISASPWTVPSHATFFTGLAPREHDCWFGGRRWLDDGLETVAERFQARGVETAAFYGNDNLAPANLLQGFELRVDLDSPPTGTALGWLMRFTGIGLQQWIDRGASRAVADVDSWLSRRRSDRPFFLFVNLFEAHEPYVSPWRDHRPPPGIGELESFFVLRGYQEPVWQSLGRRDGRDESIVRAAYRASIRYQDRRLGDLLAAIGRHFELDRLPIVITADHGENLGEGGRWGHQYALNDELIRIPFVIRAPGLVGAGERVAGSFSSIDLPATLLDLAGGGASFGRGRSLLGIRAGEAATFAEDFPFYTTLNRLERDFRTSLGDFRWPLSAVRGEGYKLVLWHGGPTRLYDLNADPREEKDLLASRPEVAARLLARFAAWSREVPRRHRGEGENAKPPALLDPHLADELRALGYL